MDRPRQPNDIVVDAANRFYIYGENFIVALGRDFEPIPWVDVTEPVSFFRSAFKKEVKAVTIFLSCKTTESA